MPADYVFDAEVYRHSGTTWFFVTVPADVSADIRARTDGPKRPGFGSIRVRVSIEDVSWDTSIFPESGNGSFVLPIKKQVRSRCDLTDGDTATVRLALHDPAFD